MLGYINPLERLSGLNLPQSIKNKLDSIVNSEYFPLLDSSGFDSIIRIIEIAIEEGWQEEEINELLFSPSRPSNLQISAFRKRHQEIYSQESIHLAEEISSSSSQFFAISSCMYAGKSTLAAEVCRRLEGKGYRVITMVPFFMGDFITIRGRECTADDEVGEDGFARITAVQYNPETYQHFFESLCIDREEPTVIHFDEYSFLPSDAIIQFIEFIKQNYPNVKVIFVGLNKNLLGQDLEGYTAVQGVVSQEFSCKSFVPSLATETSDLSSITPTGTFTARYLILPDGTTILDCGFLPIVVEKELSQLVYYTPTECNRHLYTLLDNERNQELLNRVINPDDTQQYKREQLLYMLKRNIIERAEES